jgi:hypothetical protein
MRHTCQFQNLGSEVFKDSRSINGRLSANTYVILCAYFQVPMDTSNRELKEKKNAMDGATSLISGAPQVNGGKKRDRPEDRLLHCASVSPWLRRLGDPRRLWIFRLSLLVA